MFKSLFPVYTRSKLVQPLVFTLSTIFFVIFDSAQLISGLQATSTLSIMFSLALNALFVTSGWFQICEYVFVVCYLVIRLLNLIDGFEMVSFSLTILMVF